MTGKPTVLVTRRLPEAVTTRLHRDYDARTNDADELIDPARLPKLAREAGATALLPCPTDKLSKGVIDDLPPAIRIISTFSVGHEHIDLATAKARGIIVTNTPDVLTDATADIAMLLILGAARRVYEGERMVREATWGSWAPTGMLGIHVTGKRLGIYGMGRIGRALARRARGFDMAIHYYNRARLSPDLEGDAIFHASPEDLLRVRDFLSINAPATPETRHFLNADRIKLLPDPCVVVNTARGMLVDDAALIDALKSGRVAAAGLDVFDGEPNINPGYRPLTNTFLLPHLGSATIDTRNAMGFKCLDNLDAYFAGKDPPDRVV